MLFTGYSYLVRGKDGVVAFLSNADREQFMKEVGGVFETQDIPVLEPFSSEDSREAMIHNGIAVADF